MNPWIIAAAVVVVPMLLVAYSLCKAASDADDVMDGWDHYDWDDIWTEED